MTWPLNWYVAEQSILCFSFFDVPHSSLSLTPISLAAMQEEPNSRT